MTLSAIINEYMTRHNISGREFARRCGEGISYPYIAKIIKDEKTAKGRPLKIHDEKLSRIAYGLEMSLGELKDKMKNTGDKSTVFIHPPELEAFNLKIADMIESEIQARVEEQMKGKADPIDDPDDWIPLAPGFDKMPPAFQHDFKVAVNNVWKLYHDLTNQQRKDEPQ